jgi:sialate O-acetylesterase
VQGFAVAGEDKKWHAAEATISGDKKNQVVVKSKDVPNPVAVRYAWADNPVCNLYDASGLPVTPFRSDDWKGVTDDVR